MGVIGLIAGTLPARRMLFGVLFVPAATVTVVALSPISDAIAARWVREDAFPASGVAAAVVLSGTVNPDTTISSGSLDHLVSGLELVRSGGARVLVTTTTAEVFPAGLVSSETDQARIISLFDGQASWIRTTGGNSTRDEALASARTLLPRGAKRIAVIASPIHTRRACAAFESVGFVVTCVPARMRDNGGRPVSPLPNARLAIFGQWVYEVAAMLEYGVRGWLS
jgi:uncharacterized SAM-binding protein YcdF (DUF218 family)